MTFIKMQQPAHDLKDMKHHREMASKLFVFSIPESVAAMNYI